MRARERARADEHAEQRERGIDERAVRELPRAVGRVDQTIVIPAQSVEPGERAEEERGGRVEPRRAARAASAASTSATPPIQTSGAFECPPPKKRAQNETAAAARPGASPPNRWPAARTGGDASIGRYDAKIRSQTVYIGITARTLTLETTESAGRGGCALGWTGMKTTARQPHATMRLLFAAALGVLALLAAGAGAAAAAPSAVAQPDLRLRPGRDQRLARQQPVDQIYAIPCYTQAIQHLSSYPDLEGYSSAADDIHDALLAALRQDRGGGGTGGGPRRAAAEQPVGPRRRRPTAPEPHKSFITRLGDRLGPGNAQSIPLPLLVLGGLALLLLLAAARDLDRTPPPGPPHDAGACARAASVTPPAARIPSGFRLFCSCRPVLSLAFRTPR